MRIRPFLRLVYLCLGLGGSKTIMGRFGGGLGCWCWGWVGGWPGACALLGASKCRLRLVAHRFPHGGGVGESGDYFARVPFDVDEVNRPEGAPREANDWEYKRGRRLLRRRHMFVVVGRA